MKKIAFLVFVMFVSLFATAQKLNDKIVLKNGGIIKCHIVETDTVNNVIKFIASEKEGVKEFSLNNVKTYTIDSKEYKGKFAKSFLESSLGTNLNEEKTPDYNIESGSAGEKLVSFSSTAQIGLALMFAGTLVTAFPSIMPTENRDPVKLDERTRQLTTVGLVVTSVGFVTFFASFGSARSAGNLLNNPKHANVGVTNDGLTLKIPIKQK
jgi:hypothetical protein